MQVQYGSKLYVPQTSYHLPAAQQEPHKKAYLLANTTEQFSGNKSGELTISRKRTTQKEQQDQVEKQDRK